MVEITASLVKELRERTGAGMMDCKKALSATDGDPEAAADWLRTKGLAAAAKRSGKVAAEGLVAIASGPQSAALIEVNSETDFVARNDSFQAFVKQVAALALEHGGDTDAIAGVDYPGTGRTVAEEATNLTATIGEHIGLRRTRAISVDKGVVATYVHGALSPGIGRIGVAVAIESGGDPAMLTEFGKQIAMHVAATGPRALTPEDLDPDEIARERAVLAEQARESGKSDNIIEKMVEGRSCSSKPSSSTMRPRSQRLSRPYRVISGRKSVSPGLFVLRLVRESRSTKPTSPPKLPRRPAPNAWGAGGQADQASRFCSARGSCMVRTSRGETAAAR